MMKGQVSMLECARGECHLPVYLSVIFIQNIHIQGYREIQLI